MVDLQKTPVMLSDLIPPPNVDKQTLDRIVDALMPDGSPLIERTDLTQRHILGLLAVAAIQNERNDNIPGCTENDDPTLAVVSALLPQLRLSFMRKSRGELTGLAPSAKPQSPGFAGRFGGGL